MEDGSAMNRCAIISATIQRICSEQRFAMFLSTCSSMKTEIPPIYVFNKYFLVSYIFSTSPVNKANLLAVIQIVQFKRKIVTRRIWTKILVHVVNTGLRLSNGAGKFLIFVLAVLFCFLMLLLLLLLLYLILWFWSVNNQALFHSAQSNKVIFNHLSCKIPLLTLFLNINVWSILK